MGLLAVGEWLLKIDGRCPDPCQMSQESNAEPIISEVFDRSILSERYYLNVSEGLKQDSWRSSRLNSVRGSEQVMDFKNFHIPAIDNVWGSKVCSRSTLLNCV